MQTPVEPADSGWVERAQRGDPEALDWLVRAHWERVQRLILRMFGPRQDLEDLVQTTFLETLRALPNFRRESSLSTFVSGIAVRVVMRARRPSKVMRGSTSMEVQGEMPARGPMADAELERQEALRRVQAILERVSEHKRMAFMLWAIEGMPVDQVAEAMQASVAATRSRIFYAQKAIKASAARDPYLRRWLDGGEGS
ncbi:MAG TPA: sigma-70 family RNA polymerase sigma factor [Polyangiales bacterium]|nr:sigma-70 family RNA polymerase sigma factor [Polyangiales bacterium]